MTWKPPETLDGSFTGLDEHGPLQSSRISSADYAPNFLRDLQLRNEVVPVRNDWNGDSRGFPPHVTWVVYPNGDLERIGFA